jgi:hypothetical protein
LNFWLRISNCLAALPDPVVFSFLPSFVSFVVQQFASFVPFFVIFVIFVITARPWD